MTLQQRYLDYFLRRLRHLTYLTYRDIAVERGLLSVTRSNHPEIACFQVGPAAAQLLTGDRVRDDEFVRRIIQRRYRTSARSEDARDDSPTTDSGALHIRWPVVPCSRINSLPAGSEQHHKNVDESSYILSILREMPRPLRADKVLVSLLISISLDGYDLSVKEIGDCLKKPTWFFGIGGSVKGLSAVLGRLLESGAFWPTELRFRDGNRGYSISGRYHQEDAIVSHRTAISMTATELRQIGPEPTRRLIERALKNRVPILVTDDEGGHEWPARILGAADYVIDLPKLDASVIATTIALCTGLQVDAIKAEISRHGLSCDRVSTDDLALAVGRERSASDLILRLVALTETEAETQQSGARSGGGKNPTSSAVPGTEPSRSKGERRSGRSAITSANRIEPHPHSATDSDILEPGERIVTIESLAGFGAAKDWALGLQQDLVLWQDGRLPWSDVSSKILISGPPGTGKTTFPRALCNSLRIPLFPSSVTNWLEQGYLGDVLRRMSAAFAAAQDSAPSILFIDEVDGIGKRGDSNRPHADYWNQVVNRSLELLDGALKTEGVIIVAATNYPDRIDEALMRAGRLETHIPISKPDPSALAEIFRFHLGSDLDFLISPPLQESSSVAKRIRKGKN